MDKFKAGDVVRHIPTGTLVTLIETPDPYYVAYWVPDASRPKAYSISVSGSPLVEKVDELKERFSKEDAAVVSLLRKLKKEGEYSVTLKATRTMGYLEVADRNRIYTEFL